MKKIAYTNSDHFIRYTKKNKKEGKSKYKEEIDNNKIKKETRNTGNKRCKNIENVIN